MSDLYADPSLISRRAALINGSLVLGGAICAAPSAGDTSSNRFCVGLLTDLHYADKPPAGSRHYRDTPAKLEVAAQQFAQAQPDFLVELGDLIDAADSVEKELGYLRYINRDLSAIAKERHYVLGNHCVYTLTKQEFLGEVGQSDAYYSFDRGGWHFVVLDSCFRSDGVPYGRSNFSWKDPNIPAAELDWLQQDLKATAKPTIVFAHQRLDVSNNHGVRNAPAVCKVLESSAVQLVLQGHSHANDYREINGIHYCTLVAMIEGSGTDSNGYSVMTLRGNGTIEISGFRKQNSYAWPNQA